MLAVVGLFATRPIRDDIREALPEIIRDIPEEMIDKLRKAEMERSEIVSFIETRSNEIFLIKIPEYPEEQIVRRFNASKLPKMVDDLRDVEAELDRMAVKYAELRVPERFKRILLKIAECERIVTLSNYFNTLPFWPIG